ncbi:hypothetical protein CDAR_177431 [Caerostris darwini]|uniref:Uncharacterized protein n=1 Tax=Caerostris darwini TaxID=1538125 RepID=A0AAV4P2Y6_9ARAC|nr:hypothetical protein CDAR_177431 [Caerostris darwini]
MQFKKSDKFFSRNLSNPLQNQENEAHINPDNCSIGCMRHTGTTIRLKAAAKKKNLPRKGKQRQLIPKNFQFQKTRNADAKAIKHLSVVSSNKKKREKKKWTE